MPENELFNEPTIEKHTESNPVLLDMHELARIFHCSFRYIQQMHAEGLLPTPLKIGRKNLWRASAIEKFLSALEETQPEPRVAKRGRPTKLEQRRRRIAKSFEC